MTASLQQAAAFLGNHHCYGETNLTANKYGSTRANI